MNKFAKGAGENGDLAVSGGGQEFLISDIKVSLLITECGAWISVLRIWETGLKGTSFLDAERVWYFTPDGLVFLV